MKASVFLRLLIVALALAFWPRVPMADPPVNESFAYKHIQVLSGKDAYAYAPYQPDSVELQADVAPCADEQACADNYLWARYEMFPKGNVFSKYFGWKDDVAAKRLGMTRKEYVIGGMDPRVRIRMAAALHTLDDAGLNPCITSAFRDDYRQQIATGYKARTGYSWHGGSKHGGYGNGAAADLVSCNRDDRDERIDANEKLWDYIDAHSAELGIGHPYPRRDRPHVGLVDGEEYVCHRLHAGSCGFHRGKETDAEPKIAHHFTKKQRTARG
jgi:hypothetical protein